MQTGDVYTYTSSCTPLHSFCVLLVQNQQDTEDGGQSGQAELDVTSFGTEDGCLKKSLLASGEEEEKMPGEPPGGLRAPCQVQGLPCSLQAAARHGCPEKWTWDKRDRSHEVRLHGPRLQTAQFHPNWSNGTAGVRGTMALNYGVHYWEVQITQRIFGTSMMFGIGTKDARLHVDAFVNLLGEDEQSWGLSHKGLLWHNGKWRQFTKAFRENEATTVGLLFDWFQGTLTYYKDGLCLGVAFTGLNKIQEDLYPIVCSTAAKTEMSLGVTLRGFESLQDRCRASIAKRLQQDYELEGLPLPSRIKAYIKELMTPVTSNNPSN